MAQYLQTMGNSKNEDNKSLLFLAVIFSEVLCLFLLAFGQTEESNCESGCHTGIREVLQFSQTGARWATSSLSYLYSENPSKVGRREREQKKFASFV